MAWNVKIDPHASKELEGIDHGQRKQILQFLFERVATLEDPRLIGKPMSGEAYRDLWIYRKGDYRILCSFFEESRTVAVFRVGHRRDVYDRLSF